MFSMEPGILWTWLKTIIVWELHWPNLLLGKDIIDNMEGHDEAILLGLFMNVWRMMNHTMKFPKFGHGWMMFLLSNW